MLEKSCEMDSPVTDREILHRLDTCERQMTALSIELKSVNERLTQAAGAWMFIKILCSLAIGFAVIYNSIYTFFK